MELRGMANGFSAFLVEPRIFTKDTAGYQGVIRFPTMWVMAATPQDAIIKTEDILGSQLYKQRDKKVTNYAISAVDADPNSAYRNVTYCGNRRCITCGIPWSEPHDNSTHRFHHTCIDNICREVTD